jgi:hypothetical protein
MAALTRTVAMTLFDLGVLMVRKPSTAVNGKRERDFPSSDGRLCYNGAHRCGGLLQLLYCIA